MFVIKVLPVWTTAVKVPIPTVLVLRINLMVNAIKHVATSDSHSRLFQVFSGFGVLWLTLQVPLFPFSHSTKRLI
jgi:hypothetical protein